MSDVVLRTSDIEVLTDNISEIHLSKPDGRKSAVIVFDGYKDESIQAERNVINALEDAVSLMWYASFRKQDEEPLMHPAVPSKRLK